MYELYVCGADLMTQFLIYFFCTDKRKSNLKRKRIYQQQACNYNF
jgi:hypothetical protein